MFKNAMENLKNALVKTNNKNPSVKTKNKKSMENLITLAIILIITIVAINYIWKDDNKSKKNEPSSNKILANENIIESNTGNDNSESLEERLKKTLSKINGVGEVDVLITYSQTSIVNPIYNEDKQESITEEEDTSGGKRTISTTNNKKEVVSSDNNIITQSVTSPQIQGAVITAKGAGDINVKTNIIQAVEAATGLSTYKIQVFEMN